MKSRQYIHQHTASLAGYPLMSVSVSVSVIVAALAPVSALMSKAVMKHLVCVAPVWRARSNRGRWLGVSS